MIEGIHTDFAPEIFPVVTRRLLLRPYRMGDLAQMASRLMEVQRPYLQSAQADILAQAQLEKALNSNPRQHVTLGGFLIDDDATLVLQFEAHVTGKKPGEWAVGYHTLEPFRRQGYMNECVKALMPTFKQHLSARFLMASTGDTNAGSKGVLKNNGFMPVPSGAPQRTAFQATL